MDDSPSIADLLQTVRANPKDARSRLKLGELYAEKGEYASALAMFEGVGKFYADGGYVLKAVSAYKQVRALLKDKAPELEPDYENVLPILADLLQRVGLGDEAAGVLVDIGDRLMREHRDTEAVDMFRRASELAPEHPTAERRLLQAMTRSRPTSSGVDLSEGRLSVPEAAPPPPPVPAPVPTPTASVPAVRPAASAPLPPPPPLAQRPPPRMSAPAVPAQPTTMHTRPTAHHMEAVQMPPRAVPPVKPAPAAVPVAAPPKVVVAPTLTSPAAQAAPAATSPAARAGAVPPTMHTRPTVHHMEAVELPRDLDASPKAAPARELGAIPPTPHNRPTVHNLESFDLASDASDLAPSSALQLPPVAPAPKAPAIPHIEASPPTRPTMHGLEAVHLPPPALSEPPPAPKPLTAPGRPLPPPAPGPPIPVIDTPRLRLRGHKVADFAAAAAMWGDPVVTRHIGGRPFSEEETWSKLLRYAGLWATLGYGYWVIEERATRKFIGEVGFANFKRDMEPSVGDSIEIGWVLASASHGQGFATEAVIGALTWGDRHFNGNQTICIIDPGNLASIGVARKAGYRGAERRLYKGAPVVVSFR